MPSLARCVIMLAGAAAAIAPSVRRACAENAIAPAAPAHAVIADPSYPFSLPPLPYTFIANEPHIDAQTKELHHDKHHAASGVSWRRRRNATNSTTAMSCPGWRAAHCRFALKMVCLMSADGPHAGQRALLTYAGFILPPDFQRFAGSVGR